MNNENNPFETSSTPKITPDETPSPRSGARPPQHRAPWYKRLSKKQWIIIAVVAVLLIGGGLAYFLTRGETPIVHVSTPKPAAPKPITSELTGVEVSAADAKRPVTGVMIENTVFARPQSGLRQAGVVFEAIAEYGITRFLALYQEGKPANIGPVRSARPYYINWARGFDASYAHVGGSPEALAYIKSAKVKDLDQFYNSAAYHRISSREAPHNAYTNMSALNKLEKSKGWFKPAEFTGFERKADSPVTTAGTGGASAQTTADAARTIELNISGPTYNVHYGYDKAHNTYLRSMGGERHLDASSRKQLAPKVVVAMVLPYKLESDGYHSNYKTTGHGTAYIFQDGKVTKGIWYKGSATSPLQFKTADNTSAIKLNAGQTWISALRSSKDVTYKP